MVNKEHEARLESFLDKLKECQSDYDIAIQQGATADEACEYDSWVIEWPEIHQGDPCFQKWRDYTYAIEQYELEMLEQEQKKYGFQG